MYAEKKRLQYSHKKKTKIIWRLVVFFLVLFLLAGIGGTMWFFIYHQEFARPPWESVRLNSPNRRKFMTGLGKLYYMKFTGEENRTIIPSKNISQHLKDATIVAEDFNFYRTQRFGFLNQ